jgi:hypothetical protein
VVCLTSFAYGQNPCAQGTKYRGCKACGTAASVKGKTLNVQKNRGTKATHPHEITLAEMRDPANNNTFSPTRRVWVKAFVASVVPNATQVNQVLVHGHGRAVSRLAPPGERVELISSTTPQRSFTVVPDGKQFVLTDVMYEAPGQRSATGTCEHRQRKSVRRQT